MERNLSQSLGDASVGACSCVGLLALIEEHSSLFMLGISATSLCVAILFYTLNYRLRLREVRLKEKEAAGERLSK